MFVFQFDGPLFKFSANTPALLPLSQFPPRSAAAGRGASALPLSALRVA